ncbi:MAG: exo-alpha-sialidase, partial [Planctomycetaceae bacterium]|nr:exo-alpha-sialidase [Planctomycetaceae bacterium]
KFVVARTTDGGATSEVLTNGLPGKHSYDIVYRHALDVDETGDVLAVGSTTGNLWISENGGDAWQTISNYLPPVYCVRFVKA